MPRREYLETMVFLLKLAIGSSLVYILIGLVLTAIGYGQLLTVEGLLGMLALSLPIALVHRKRPGKLQ